MKIAFSILAGFLTLSYVNSTGQTPLANLQVQEMVKTQAKYGLDPDTPVMSRIHPTDTSTLSRFREAGMSPVEHALSKEEYDIVANAIELLPEIHKRIFQGHLRSINFLDDMPNTALTSTINVKDDFKLFDITIRAAILRMTVSEWLTEKENTVFNASSATPQIIVNAGNLNALVYVLLHEGTHVVDGSLEMMPRADSSANDFTRNVWLTRTAVASSYQDDVLDGIAFKRNGKKVSTDQAIDIYSRLKKSPFASLYSRNSWHEDFAEFVTIYHFTKVLRQPIKFTVRQNNKIIFELDPMSSKLVNRRVRHLNEFYKDS